MGVTYTYIIYLWCIVNWWSIYLDFIIIARKIMMINRYFAYLIVHSSVTINRWKWQNNSNAFLYLYKIRSANGIWIKRPAGYFEFLIQNWIMRISIGPLLGLRSTRVDFREKVVAPSCFVNWITKQIRRMFLFIYFVLCKKSFVTFFFHGDSSMIYCKTPLEGCYANIYVFIRILGGACKMRPQELQNKF